jgi:hypothetical protein
MDSQPLAGLSLAKFNQINSEEEARAAEEGGEKEWGRLEGKWKVSGVGGEQPICLVSASYNNYADFRI